MSDEVIEMGEAAAKWAASMGIETDALLVLTYAAALYCADDLTANPTFSVPLARWARDAGVSGPRLRKLMRQLIGAGLLFEHREPGYCVEFIVTCHPGGG